MSLKLKRLALIYTAVALIALSLLAWGQARQLSRLRLTARYESSRAFEAAVTASEGLSAAFQKLSYVTDEALGKSLCAQALADALSAETALSVLPFDTQELEKLQGFLGRAGDYAGSLCALTELSLPDEHRRHLRDYGAAAGELTARLRQMQAKLHDGSVEMDRRETLWSNVGASNAQKLSALLLDYEEGFTAPAEFPYEGRYSPARETEPGSLSPEEAVSLAAKAAQVEPRELREEYDYEGPDGRRAYSAGGLLLGVSRRGLEFMGRSRLVGTAALTVEQARKNAEDFLTRMGYENLVLFDARRDENVAVFRYAPAQDGVPRPDDALRISIALDDGSVYAFDAAKYRPQSPALNWAVGEEEARATLPEGVELVSARRLVRKSPGGSDVACWELSVAADGRSARVYVDAATGRQWRVDLDE